MTLCELIELLRRATNAEEIDKYRDEIIPDLLSKGERLSEDEQRRHLYKEKDPPENMGGFL